MISRELYGAVRSRRECKDEMKEQECYSMLSKVLIEREQLKEQLEYERSVRGKDSELEKLQHCTVDELEKLRQERDDLKKEISDLREQVSTSVQQQDAENITDKWASTYKTFCEDLQASGLRDEDVQAFEKTFFNIGVQHKRILDHSKESTALVEKKEEEIEAVKDIIKNHEVTLDELRLRNKRYRSERNAMRIAIVDALDKAPPVRVQGKHMNKFMNKFRARFANSLKNAHKGIEIRQTYDDESEHATSELIKLLKTVQCADA